METAPVTEGYKMVLHLKFPECLEWCWRNTPMGRAVPSSVS